MPERAELLEALRHIDPDVRRRAARALDHLPLDEQTVEALIELARRETIPAVRSAAVHVLACEGCKSEACRTSHDIVGLLIDILRNDVSADVRRQTIDGLRSADTESRVRAALREALNDTSFKVRWKAACIILPFEEREVMRANR
ncbi:MAG TPA: HEAT repeat domain-containing protein [Roseiflexaceae bacterium]|nr:HEAT repeat domain-containing protein [Roseiflexaceae bacterium]